LECIAVRIERVTERRMSGGSPAHALCRAKTPQNLSSERIARRVGVTWMTPDLHWLTSRACLLDIPKIVVRVET
jgi:hypothetical protein